MSTVCIIGAGAAGLISAKTLLDDGFNVTVLTRDRSPGGVWAEERVYPGLSINNVHGEFRFSSLPMPPPVDGKTTGGRLTGDAMRKYMESFADRFLKNRIQYGVEVKNVLRNECGKWTVELEHGKVLLFDKLVLCTGGCSQPYVPPNLSPSAAQDAGFKGPVFHSQKFKANLDSLLGHPAPGVGTIALVGGGRSAQDIAAYLVSQGQNVAMIFDKADAFIAAPIPLPGFIRKSRLLAVLSPHIHLRTRLERFLHTTSIGSTITKTFWSFLTWSSFFSFSIPATSPFRNAHSLFWGIRTNDEGVGSPSGFYSAIKENKVKVVSPARVKGFSEDGKGLLLENGDKINAEAVILCTGFASSWDPIIDGATRNDLGLVQKTVNNTAEISREWDDYISLANPPALRSETAKSAASLYRGLVPVRNLFKRDFAVNGSIFTTNNGYTFEVSAHWISSYFLGDGFFKLPQTINDAQEHTEMTAAWLRRRYPGMLSWTNESYSSGIAFWSYPQFLDELLEDMDLPIHRSGGSWLTWPLKVIDLKEIENLHGERGEKRKQYD